jgi:hypothetical protein
LLGKDREFINLSICEKGNNKIIKNSKEGLLIRNHIYHESGIYEFLKIKANTKHFKAIVLSYESEILQSTLISNVILLEEKDYFDHIIDLIYKFLYKIEKHSDLFAAKTIKIHFYSFCSK